MECIRLLQCGLLIVDSVVLPAESAICVPQSIRLANSVAIQPDIRRRHVIGTDFSSILYVAGADM